MSTLGFEQRSVTSNKPTHYLLDQIDFISSCFLYSLFLLALIITLLSLSLNLTEFLFSHSLHSIALYSAPFNLIFCSPFLLFAACCPFQFLFLSCQAIMQNFFPSTLSVCSSTFHINFFSLLFSTSLI